MRKKIPVICDAYQLGRLEKEASPLQGGALHSSWKIQTETGCYVIKQINPAHRARKNQFSIAEEIGDRLSTSISAVTALKHQGDSIFSWGQDLFLVFPYHNARILTQAEIQDFHVRTISDALAKIHASNLTIKNPPEVEIFHREKNHWEKMLNNIKRTPVAFKILESQIDFLEKLQAAYREIEPFLKNNLVISHRDFDPKNVLWDSQDNYYLIDWESAGLINKTKDLVSTALYWSFDEAHHIQTHYFDLFLQTYFKNSEHLNTTEIRLGALGLFGDWLNWLDFNFERILNHPPENSEHVLGLKEAKKTLNALPIVWKQIDI